MSALPDTDSYSNTNTDTDRIGSYCYVKNSVQWTDIDACTNSNADGTKIGMDKVGFNFTSVSQSVPVPVWLSTCNSYYRNLYRYRYRNQSWVV